jgi:hypothetical protein
VCLKNLVWRCIVRVSLSIHHRCSSLEHLDIASFYNIWKRDEHRVRGGYIEGSIDATSTCSSHATGRCLQEEMKCSSSIENTQSAKVNCERERECVCMMYCSRRGLALYAMIDQGLGTGAKKEPDSWSLRSRNTRQGITTNKHLSTSSRRHQHTSASSRTRQTPSNSHYRHRCAPSRKRVW